MNGDASIPLHPGRPAAPADGREGAPAARHGGWRVDIQLLRGLAVGLVVLQHARVPFVPGGFLGVDIFFVISGYLMTGLIVDAIDAGRFGFRDFYARRVRRLLPAAYATITVTALLAPWLLDAYEFRNFLDQVVGSFTFTVNVVLWQQIDYFNSAAALKPLLHMWSLAVEEQFYIVVPFLLVLCPPRRRLALTVALVAVSLALCLIFVRRSPSAAFYFLPFRAWELGFGSVAALVARRGGALPGIAPALRGACALVLLGVPALVDERAHPGLPAIAVCVATALLLVTGSTREGAGLARPLAWLGDRSYSLYLVHWPVFAFANNVFIEPPSLATNLALLAVCAAWMEVQYRLIERRYRLMPVDRRTLPALVGVPVVVIGLCLAWNGVSGRADLADRQGNMGFGEPCAIGGDFTPLRACQSSDRPTTMVWGDSYAMHLVAGLAATTPAGIVQATRSVCGPFLDVAPMNGVQFQEPWAEHCIGFNRSVLDYLASRPEIETVVLSSSLVQYIPGAEVGVWNLLMRTEGGRTVRPIAIDLLEAALARTVEAVRRLGRRVVFVAPPPALDFDIGRCLSRFDAGRPTVFPYQGCDFPRADYEATRAQTRKVVADIRAAGTVPVVDFDDVLCAGGTCRTHLDGIPLYRDQGHLSTPGSRRLGQRVDLGALVAERAR